jgi:transcriptional regulator with XRE-family HTH domain
MGMGELSHYLKKGMLEQELNYSRLAQGAGVSAVYVMKVVKGERIPSDAVVGKLANVLGLDHRKALFLAHRDKTPEEFRGLFRFPEPLFPTLREKLLELYGGGGEDIRRMFEIDPLGQVEKSLVTLFARLIAEHAIIDGSFGERFSLGREFLERLEWGEAYFEQLTEELHSPAKEKSFCDALSEVLRGWDLISREDVVRVRFKDGRDREYKFCLLDKQKFRSELVLESVRSRAIGREKVRVSRGTQVSPSGEPEKQAEIAAALPVEPALIDEIKDDIMRDIFINLMKLPPEDREETRDIIALKLRRSERRS